MFLLATKSLVLHHSMAFVILKLAELYTELYLNKNIGLCSKVLYMYILVWD